jgi:hypothetical protein
MTGLPCRKEGSRSQTRHLARPTRAPGGRGLVLLPICTYNTSLSCFLIHTPHTRSQYESMKPNTYPEPCELRRVNPIARQVCLPPPTYSRTVMNERPGQFRSTGGELGSFHMGSDSGRTNQPTTAREGNQQTPRSRRPGIPASESGSNPVHVSSLPECDSSMWEFRPTFPPSHL